MEHGHTLPRDPVEDAGAAFSMHMLCMCFGGEIIYNGKIGLNALTDVNDNDWLIDDALSCLGEGPAEY